MPAGYTYMNVTMLSDITKSDGRSIEEWALKGSRKAPTQIEYPRQQRPPKASWKYWRDLLHSTFLTKDRTADHFPLYTPMIRRAKARKPRTKRKPKLQDAIEELPDHYKEVLGNYTLPEDDGEAIFTQLQSPIGVEAWTDGTVKDGKGAHAYTIRTITDSPSQCIEGKSMTPGDPRTISSLRTEHYGALATVLLLQCIWNTHQTSESEGGKVKIHIDNSTVIDRSYHQRNPTTNDSNIQDVPRLRCMGRNNASNRKHTNQSNYRTRIRTPGRQARTLMWSTRAFTPHCPL